MHVEAFAELHPYFFHGPDREEPEGFMQGEAVGITFGDAGDDRMQACYDLKNLETKNREIRALIKAGKELACDNLLVITKEKEGTETVEWFGDTAVVSFVPLWKWLVEQ